MNDIVKDSHYLVKLFLEDKKDITQLHIQKLMYLVEAYYLNIYTEDTELYECKFNAWAFGPVAIPLYRAYKNFGKAKIEIEEEKLEQANKLDNKIKEVIKKVYEAFKNFNAIELVNVTHKEDSPWAKVWEKNEKKVVAGEKSFIDKIETRDWFRTNFLLGNNE